MNPTIAPFPLVADHIAASSQVEFVSISKITQHVARLVFDDQVLVVKTFAPDHERTAKREILGAAASAVALGDWVPRLHSFGTVDQTGHHYVAYDEIPGMTLHDAVRSCRLDRSDALRLLGTILHRLHRSTRPGFGPVAAATTDNAADFLHNLVTERSSKLRARGHQELATMLDQLTDRWSPALATPRPAVLCHGDLHPKNVVVRADDDYTLTARGVLDFESVIYAVPEYDLAKTLVVSSAFDNHDRRALAAGYSPHEINEALLTGLITYHTIDGWLWAAQIEHRDRRLWCARLGAVLGTANGM